jgi:hypothetical protein
MKGEASGRDPRSWGNGWAGHDEERLLRWARSSLAQKLEWLEQMHRLALTLKESRRSRSSGDRGGKPDGSQGRRR